MGPEHLPMFHVNKCGSASFFLLYITYTQKSAQIIHVQHHNFSKSEHTNVTSSQIKKQNLSNIPEALLAPWQSPLSKITSVLTSTIPGLAAPAFELYINGIIQNDSFLPLPLHILFARFIHVIVDLPSQLYGILCIHITRYPVCR